jgi:hypothetical protein
MRTILVVANETLTGGPLLERARAEVAAGDIRVVLCVPRRASTHGNFTYADNVYEAAQVRVDLARGVLREIGIDCVGEVGDPDPYSATIDAIAEYDPDLILISTLPEGESGWLANNVVERVSNATEIPVEHIVTEQSAGSPFDVTLVVANRTTNSDALIAELEKLASSEAAGRERLFVFLVPIEGGDGLAAKRARARLTQVVERAQAQGMPAAGLIGDPDPYTATMNALAFFDVDDIVISTYPQTRSGWLRADLIERVKKSSGLTVDHIVAEPAAARSGA